MGHARPMLVTGMPRPGTTWLARELASAPRAALTGWEPMNARNRKYAFGRIINGWERLRSLPPREARIFKSVYLGLNPWVYRRYGYRQWLGPLPCVRCVVKDPFAGEVRAHRMHNLDRDPRQVAAAWMKDVNGEELARLDRITGEVQDGRKRARPPVPAGTAAARGSA